MKKLYTYICNACGETNLDRIDKEIEVKCPDCGAINKIVK